MPSITLSPIQISAFHRSIDDAVTKQEIRGSTAHFAKGEIAKYSHDFDIRKFKSWATHEVPKYDKHAKAATTLTAIVDNILQTSTSSTSATKSAVMGCSTSARDHQLANFDFLLTQAQGSGKITPATYTNTMRCVRKYAASLNSKDFEKFLIQVAKFDPIGVDTVRNAFKVTIIFDSLLDEAQRSGKITHATYTNTMKCVIKYADNLNSKEFEKFLSQVARFDPKGVDTVRNAFSTVIMDSSGASSPTTGLLAIPAGVKHSSYAPFTPDDSTRFFVRDKTKSIVDSQPLDTSSMQETLSLYEPEIPSADAQRDRALLPRFGALTVKGLPQIGYGSSWTSSLTYPQFDATLPTKSLSATYIASPNIGESAHSADAPDYRNSDGSLNEAKFLTDFQKVCLTGFEGQQRNGAEHFVWNPIGMGAFMRNVHKNFSGITPAYVAHLKDQLALQMIIAFDALKAPQKTLHLCLFTGTEESDKNHNAYIRAIEQTPGIVSNIHIHQNGDMLEIGQHLANKYGNGKADVIIAANRQLLGNFWRSDRARFASDENIHRRWPRLTQIANFLNGSQTSKSRAPQELQRTLHSI